MFRKLEKTFVQFASHRILLHRSMSIAEVTPDNKKTLDSELENAKPFKDIPGDLRLPLLGTSWTVLPIVGKYRYGNANMYRCLKYGKIARNDIGPFLKFVHLYDVKDFEKVFRHEGRYPVRLPFQSIQVYREKRKNIYPTGGLLVDSDKEWYNMRFKTQKHMLRPASVLYYLPGMDSISCEMIQRMDALRDSNGEISDFLKELYKWALESICLVGLDTKLNCLQKNLMENSEPLNMIKSVNIIFELMAKIEFGVFSLWKYFSTPISRKFFKAMDFASSVAQKYISEALERLKNSSVEGKEITFLENLLVTENMDMGSVNTMITDMLLAGIDTTSHTTAFALYNLARNPDAQEKLRKEIKNIFPDPNAPVTATILNECRYLKACLKESMRIIPTIPGTTRVLSEDIVLAGYRVPAGTCIIIEHMTAGHLEENFPEPKKFQPECWLRSDSQEGKIHSFGFLPFGFGPRSCIGKRVAEQELWTLLIRIFQKYKVEYHHDDIGVIKKVSNAPNKPLNLTFVEDPF